MWFSIVIPVYNRAAQLEKCLRSVAKQTFRDFEVILVDDGSTEDIAAAMHGYDLSIHYVRHPENRGPGAARNTGMRLAKGEYVTFLDSDDQWVPQTLATYAHVITNNGRPSFVAGREQRCGESGHAADAPKWKRYEDYLSSAAHPLWIGTCAVAIRTDVLRSVGGFSEQWRSGEDSDLWLRLGTTPGFVYVEDPPVFRYNRGPGTLVDDHAQAYHGVSAMLQDERADSYPGGATRKMERRLIISRHVRAYAINALRRGEIYSAWECYRIISTWRSAGVGLKFLTGFWLVLGAALCGQGLQLLRRGNRRTMGSRPWSLRRPERQVKAQVNSDSTKM